VSDAITITLKLPDAFIRDKPLSHNELYKCI